MNIKKIADSVLNFTIKRLIEIIGIFIFILGILLFLGLITYSPSDPNFIFPENEEIKNLLGFQGSYISDLFFQSIGLIAYLIPITYFFTGINIFTKKELFILLENSFFVVIYSLVGSLFLKFNIFSLFKFSLKISISFIFHNNLLILMMFLLKNSEFDFEIPNVCILLNNFFF